VDDARPPDPDPPTARPEGIAFVLVGLLGIPLLAVLVGALFLPPGIAFVLVRRGLAERHPSWVVLGALVGVLWLFMLAVTGRRILSRSGKAPPSA
jgi:hypothetical protein